jgi:hypothetical protein
MLDKLPEVAFSSVVSYVISMIFGVIFTALCFYITSNPVNSSGVQNKLLSELVSIVRSESKNKCFSTYKVDYSSLNQIDMGSGGTIFMYATLDGRDDKIKSEENESGRCLRRAWAVFDSSSQSFFDKLVGRSGFYHMSSHGYADISYDEELNIKKVSIVDTNNPGGKAILAEIESQYADRVSKTFLMLEKINDTKWVSSSIPPISNMLSGLADGSIKLNNYGKSPLKYYCCFGDKSDGKNYKTNTMDIIVKNGVYEDLWSARIDGIDRQYTSVSNGGYYTFMRHPQRGHLDVFVLTFAEDDQAVLGPHYAIASMLSYKNNEFVFDDLWNWGHPIASIKPYRTNQVDRESLIDAGISSHVVGDNFYGYTEFEKKR